MIEVPNIEKKKCHHSTDPNLIKIQKNTKKDPTHKSLNLLYKVLVYGSTFFLLCADNTIHVIVCAHRRKDKWKIDLGINIPW